MSNRAFPRVYAILAREAPIAVVFSRSPSKWWHIMRWTVEHPVSLEHGAWLHASLIPRQSDVSPNGALLCYSAFDPAATWESPWKMYRAVSKLPWLTALAAWSAVADHGATFIDDRQVQSYGQGRDRTPFHGHLGGLRVLPDTPPYDRMRNERARGWATVSARDTSKYFALVGLDPTGLKEPPIVLSKSHPHLPFTLTAVAHAPRDTHTPSVDHLLTQYVLSGPQEKYVPELAWADWTPNGQLAAATNRGTLELHRISAKGPARTWHHDLIGLKPNPEPAPSFAASW